MSSGIAQVIKKTQIDSIKNTTVSGNNLMKIQDYLELSDRYSNTNLDSSLIYAKKALQESSKIKNDSILAEVYNTIANAYEYKGQVDSSITFHYQALNKRKKLKNKILIADSYNNLGVAYDQSGKFKESLEFYFKA
ncbi:MAG: hypothetical protein CVU07_14020, partial [Bacteroidetes bacterium HGW-Bacteroidetes-23]